MKSIKVIHVANIDVALKVHFGNYFQYLVDQGYKVSYVTNPGHWLTHDTTLNDISIKIIPFKPRISPLSDFISLIRLIKYFLQVKPDIVHTHTVKPGLLGRLR